MPIRAQTREYIQTGRQDPYRGYRFRVEIDGIVSGGFSTVQGLTLNVGTYQYKEGGNNMFPHSFPDTVSWPPIVLTKGITDSTEFYDWVMMRAALEEPPQVIPPTFRRNISIQLLDNDYERVAHTWLVFGAWISTYSVTSFDASSSRVSFRRLTLTHNGWQEASIRGTELVARRVGELGSF